jgi:endonuclease/exonuclease/phosphatase (EEP) superfamily protein YafD
MAVMLPMLFALMTYNVNHANPDPEGSMDAISKADADVVLLQEITDAWKTRLEKRFATQYPYRTFHTGRAGGLAVLSKREIRADELWSPPAGGYFPAERLVVDSPLGEVQILHVHLRPNIDKGNWALGWQTTPPIRRREIETYWKKLSSGTPTIVAGDFNELPTGRAVEFLADKGLARVATTGPATWHHVVTVGTKKISALSMDIDHVVVDASFKASDAHVLDAGASDHRPVVVTLERASR